MLGRMQALSLTLSCFYFYNGPIGKALLLFYHEEAKIGGKLWSHSRSYNYLSPGSSELNPCVLLIQRCSP